MSVSYIMEQCRNALSNLSPNLGTKALSQVS